MIKLTRERLMRRWTKAELARRSRLDQALVSKIEAGRVRPYERELHRLARALGCPTNEATRLLDDMAAERAMEPGPRGDGQT